MTDDASMLAYLGSLVALIAAVLGVWWRIEGRIKAAETAATLKAESAFGAAQLVAGNLAEHKLHVAETYVTKSGLREQTEQIMSAITDVKTSMNGLNERLDRIIEGRVQK